MERLSNRPLHVLSSSTSSEFVLTVAEKMKKVSCRRFFSIGAAAAGCTPGAQILIGAGLDSEHVSCFVDRGHAIDPHIRVQPGGVARWPDARAVRRQSRLLFSNSMMTNCASHFASAPVSRLLATTWEAGMTTIRHSMERAAFTGSFRDTAAVSTFPAWPVPMRSPDPSPPRKKHRLSKGSLRLFG